MNEFDVMDNETLDDVDELLGMIFPQRGKEQLRSGHEGKTEAVHLLAGFVEANLFNMRWLLNDFAEELGVEPAFASAILSGTLQESEFTDELLTKIANVIDYDVDILRVMLGRDVVPYIELEKGSFEGTDGNRIVAQTDEVGLVDYGVYLQQTQLIELLEQQTTILRPLLDEYYRTHVSDFKKTIRIMERLLGRLQDSVEANEASMAISSELHEVKKKASDKHWRKGIQREEDVVFASKK